MATEQDTQTAETSSVFERFFRNRDLYLLMPFILGFSERQTHESPNPEESPQNENVGENNPSSPERIVLVNPFTQGMVVIEGSSNLDPLLRTLLETRRESYHPPASKASIEAMPRVEIEEEDDGECVICLEEFAAGGDAAVKEMPCKHRFHGECIEKWLGFHGSCPVCRYKMPVDEDEIGKKRDGGGEIWVRFSFNDSRMSGGSDQDNDSAVGNDNDRDNNNNNHNGSGSSPVLESDD